MAEDLRSALSRTEVAAREMCASFYMMRYRMPRQHPFVIRQVEIAWEGWCGHAERLLATLETPRENHPNG